MESLTDLVLTNSYNSGYGYGCQQPSCLCIVEGHTLSVRTVIALSLPAVDQSDLVVAGVDVNLAAPLVYSVGQLNGVAGNLALVVIRRTP